MYRYLLLLLLVFVTSHPALAQKDFSVSISPATQTLNAGRVATYTISTQRINGLNRPISLSVIVSPSSPDVTVALASSTVSPGASTTLTVTTSPQASAQTVSFTVSGTARNRTRVAQASLTINIPQFNLTVSPQTTTVVQGDSANFTVSTVGEADFNRNVTLAISTSPNAAFQISKSVLAAPSDIATLQFPTANLPPGIYTATIVASAPPVQRVANISFTVVARPPMAGMPNVRVVDGSVNLRASDDIGHLLVTGQVQNVGDGDAIFVNVTIRAFGQGGRLLETQSTFVNGFSGITSTGLFINTTLPRGRAASFQKDFAIAFLGDTQRVEFSITFMADQVNAPRANLAVTSLTRVINAAGGSDYMARVRNTGTVAARGPQVIIDGFNRGNQLFNVVIAGNGDLNDALQPNQERVFMASDVLDFDQTRINDAHAIWIDAGASTITDPALLELKGKAFEEKRNELIEMQKLTHKFILKISKNSDK